MKKIIYRRYVNNETLVNSNETLVNSNETLVNSNETLVNAFTLFHCLFNIDTSMYHPIYLISFCGNRLCFRYADSECKGGTWKIIQYYKHITE